MNEAIMSENEKAKLKNIDKRNLKKVAKAEIKKTEFPEVVVDSSIVEKMLEEKVVVETKVEIPTEGVPINESIINVNELYGINPKGLKKTEQDLQDEEDLWEEEKRAIKTDKVLNIILGAILAVLFIIIVVTVYLGLQLFGII